VSTSDQQHPLATSFCDGDFSAVNFEPPEETSVLHPCQRIAARYESGQWARLSSFERRSTRPLPCPPFYPPLGWCAINTFAYVEIFTANDHRRHVCIRLSAFGCVSAFGLYTSGMAVYCCRPCTPIHPKRSHIFGGNYHIEKFTIKKLFAIDFGD